MTAPLPLQVDEVAGGARFDTSGRYRYRLWRRWSTCYPPAVFVMLNPSTADASNLDPTCRRCVGFAREWGYGGIEVVNLFALRSTDPSALYGAADPVGPENDAAIVEAALLGPVVAAWGVHGALNRRGREVAALLRRELGKPLLCLGVTVRGEPRHPLYLKASSPRQPFSYPGD